MSLEFKSPFKSTANRKYNTWCKYTKRIDTYGCGCQHECKYCYAKGLLDFRGNWDSQAPRVASMYDIEKAVYGLPQKCVVRMGGMTDCFQPIELIVRRTRDTILLLNRCHINYLIVTKNTAVVGKEYLDIYDTKLAHFQISITATSDNKVFEYENASPVSERIAAVQQLFALGFDVSIRLSPFIIGNIDFSVLNKIKCEKILIEFLKANHFIKSSFPIDYSEYTCRYGGYDNLPLDKKIEAVSAVVGFKEKSVGEYVKDHYEYFRDNVNHNKSDCCNLTIKDNRFDGEQMEMAI